jgi:hypothetical protein
MSSSKVPVISFLVAITLFGSLSQAQAGASNKNGNPFGNGTFYNTAGTFNGVLRGVDLVGVTTFTTSTNAALSAGSLYIYNAALGGYDMSMGVVATMDPSANQLSALIFPLTPTPYYNPAINNLDAGGGSFSASMKVNPPNQTYSGQGVISEIVDSSVNPVLTTNLSFVINGCRIGN